jgi:hypothetical protein
VRRQSVGRPGSVAGDQHRAAVAVSSETAKTGQSGQVASISHRVLLWWQASGAIVLVASGQGTQLEPIASLYPSSVVRARDKMG